MLLPLVALLIAFSLLWLHCCSIDLWEYRKNGTAYTASNRETYFVYQQKRYCFPDRYTIFAYGFWSVPPGNYDSLREGQRLDSRWHSNAPNMCMLAHVDIQRTRYFVLEYVERLSGIANTAFLYRPTHEDWIVKVIDRHHPNYGNGEFLGESDFRLVQVGYPYANSTSLSADLNASTYFLRTEFARMTNHHHVNGSANNTYPLSMIDLSGADPRLIETTVHRHVYFVAAQHYRNSPAKMFFSGLIFRNPGLLVKASINVCPLIENHADFSKWDQKNWVPFDYDGEVLFVFYIWPFNVLTLTSTSGTENVGFASPIGDWIEEATMGDIPWKFGKPHGGTQAIRMGSKFGGEYLAFFHSYRGLCEDEVLQTYAMGAYTFNNFTHPGGETVFKLTSISVDPIVPLDFMYRDRWLHDRRLWGYIDYAVFPTSLIIEGENAFVMFAYQNIKNYIMKVDIQKLLSTMQRVSY